MLTELQQHVVSYEMQAHLSSQYKASCDEA